MVNWLLPPTRKYGARSPTTALSVMLANFSMMIRWPAISFAHVSTVAFDQNLSSSLWLSQWMKWIFNAIIFLLQTFSSEKKWKESPHNIIEMKLTWLNEQQFHDHDDALPGLLNNSSIYAKRRTIRDEERNSIKRLFSQARSSSSFTHGGLDVASVRILSFPIENFLVQINIVVVNGIVECDGNHLWNIFGWQISRNGRSILWTEAVRKYTNRWIAWWSSIWIIVDVYVRLIENVNIVFVVSITSLSFEKIIG